MYFTKTRATSKLITAVVVIGLAAGCSTHKDHVNAADARWKTMRSTLMLQMAQQQFDAGDLDQSEKTLTEAIKIDTKNARLYTLAGRVAMERAKLERAFHRFKLAIEMDEKHAPAYYYQGIVMQRWMRFDAAYDFYKQAYELQPDNAAYLLAMTEMLVVLDRVDEAMAILTEKMTYFDLNAGVRMAIGQLFVMRGDHRHAVDYFRQALLIRSDDLRIQEELALALLGAGQGSEAARRFESLLKQPGQADRADLKRALADSYLASGRVGQAKDIYISLTRTNPLSVETWIKLGELALTQEDSKGALLAANRIQKLAPNQYEGYLLAGVVWSKQGEVELALEMLDKAAQLAPENPTPVLLRGVTLERSDRMAEAADAYAEALRRNPGDSRARQLLAKVAAQAEQHELTID